MNLTSNYSRIAVIWGNRSMVFVQGLVMGKDKSDFVCKIDSTDVFKKFKDRPQGRELFESHLKEEMRQFIMEFGLTTKDGDTFKKVTILIDPVLIRGGYGESVFTVAVGSLPFMGNFMLSERTGPKNNAFVFVPYTKEKPELRWRPEPGEVTLEDYNT